MHRLSIGGPLLVLVLVTCTKQPPGPAAAQAASPTVIIPEVADGGAPPKLLASAPAADPDPLSLEPRPNADVADECRGSCNAKVGAALTKDLGERAKKTRRCYEKALAADPTLQGRLMIAMRISKDGTPCAVQVVKNELLTSNVSECVVNIMKSSRYSPPETRDDCTAANIPITFVPVGGSDAGTKP